MTDPIFYIDRSDIRDGKLAEVKAAMRDLAEFVAANEPQLIAYDFYLDESGTTMTVIAIHPDSESMESHMRIGGPSFRAFGPLITLRSIDVYGVPSETVVDQLRTKAEMLGGGTVTVHTLQAGIGRLDAYR